MDKIRSFQHEGRTIVLVTHSADAVGEVCDRAVVLKHGVVQFDGETGEGIRVLRDGFTQERTVEAERNPAQPFIRGVRLLDSAGKPVEVIRAGSDLVLEVDVTAPETVRSWRTGMAFDTPLGQSIFGTNTVQIGQPQGDLLGDATVRWRFTAPRLGHGEYFVRISLGGDEIGTVVLQERAARFSIDEAPTYSGIVSIPTTLEIER
jgi:ABC-2 type transport system ATP-binding protein